jgi:hypothetical protein
LAPSSPTLHGFAITANIPARRDGEHFGKIISIMMPAGYTLPMKSAFELAMSRLEKESPTQKLTDEQKAKLAEIDNEINAKIAERKLFLEDELRKAAGDPQAASELRKQLSAEIARLEEKREREKEKIRSPEKAA